MRILIINKCAPFEGRGAEQVIWKIGKRFAKAGHQVMFFCPTPDDTESIPDVEGIKFSFVKTSSKSTRGMIEFFVRGPLHYRSIYQKFTPDVVYDNPSPFPFHLAHLYGNTPMINKVHAVYGSYAFSCKEHPLVKIGTIAGEQTYRLFRGEYFITNSESTANRLRSLLDTDRNALIANPIGIDASNFEFHIPSESKQVVSISKLSPRKRISDLLRAWQVVEQNHPDADLTIAGSGPLTQDLYSLRDRLGLQTVSFPGFVSEEQKQTLLHDAALFASPTLYEGFGLSTLEAMASGCAVVASDTWGLKDYLQDGINGVTVPPKSPKLLGAAISSLLTHSGSRVRLAEAGRSTAESYLMSASLERELEYLNAVGHGEPLESLG